MARFLLKKSIVSGVIILFIVSGVSISTGEKIGISSSNSPNIIATIYVDDDNTGGPWDGSSAHPYQYIQDGIDNANNGDMILVQDGYYTENIVIDKSISLLGENKTTTTIYGSYTGDVVYITVNGVTFNHFTAKSGGINSGDSCLKLYNSSGIHNCLIKDNIFLSIVDKTLKIFAKFHLKHRRFEFCPEFRLVNKLINYKNRRETIIKKILRNEEGIW